MSQPIGIAEVRHMAQLSRLMVSAAEEKMFAEQFGRILAYVDVLNQVDTAGVAPLYTPAEESLGLRLDVASNTRTREAILANAPVTDGQCFIVPRIV